MHVECDSLDWKCYVSWRGQAFEDLPRLSCGYQSIMRGILCLLLLSKQKPGSLFSRRHIWTKGSIFMDDACFADGCVSSADIIGSLPDD
jgi:hypothetical protein